MLNKFYKFFIKSDSVKTASTVRLVRVRTGLTSFYLLFVMAYVCMNVFFGSSSIDRYFGAVASVAQGNAVVGIVMGLLYLAFCVFVVLLTLVHRSVSNELDYRALQYKPEEIEEDK